MTVAAGFSSSSASPAAPSPPSVIYFLHNTLSGRSLRYVADLESRADLGTIAGFFSLNPISLRLNGHFISSSGGSGGGGGGHGCFISNLSWKQILCYFDSRGLSSGRHALSPVSVEGRPQLNDENVIESRVERRGKVALCSESEIRETVQEDIQRLKRAKHESSSDSSMVRKTLALDSPKHKRRLCDEAFIPCTVSKRKRHDTDTRGNHDSHFGISEEGMIGFKRKLTGEEVSGCGQLWERLKEINV